MNDKINELLERVEAFKPKAAAEIEDFRIRMLGKKGELTALMEEFKSVAPELKREFGQKLSGSTPCGGNLRTPPGTPRSGFPT